MVNETQLDQPRSYTVQLALRKVSKCLPHISVGHMHSNQSSAVYLTGKSVSATASPASPGGERETKEEPLGWVQAGREAPWKPKGVRGDLFGPWGSRLTMVGQPEGKAGWLLWEAGSVRGRRLLALGRHDADRLRRWGRAQQRQQQGELSVSVILFPPSPQMKGPCTSRSTPLASTVTSLAPCMPSTPWTSRCPWPSLCRPR